MKSLYAVVAVALLFSGCVTSDPPGERPRGLGFSTAYMDTTVRPQDDFFRYANGAWLDSAEIPEDRPYTASFVELRENAQEQLRGVIETAASAENRPEGSDAQKIGDLYVSYMDSTRVEELGLSPVEEEFSQIEAIGSTDDLLRFFARSEMSGVLDPIGVIVNQDFKRPSQYMLYFTQSGLGLPDRDYYFDERFADQREKYVEHIERMHLLAGIKDADRRAAAIFGLETRLAEGHWTRVKARDREAAYNKFSINDVKALMPNFNWDLYLESIQAGTPDSIVIRQPDYFQSLDRALADTSLEHWKYYVTFRVLSSGAPRLPAAFVDESFDFYGRSLNGQPANQPRWKRAVSATDGALGERVGKLYVEKYFPEDAKARMDELVANLSEAFGNAIEELDWMSDSTKVEAHDKLAKFTAKIGYPDAWRDYSGLVIRHDDLFGNMQRANRFEHVRAMQKLDRPVDRSEWFATPQTVNAFYNPSMNDITFPAAILQAPFFDRDADDAMNYGAIGAAIGHEFSHGFDDQGRKSDGVGALRDWWTETDATEYERRAGGLVKQYSAYSPIEGMNVNGELTLGENIGDLAGLTMAYRAYQLSLDRREAPEIEGFSGDERFFLGYCQVWRSKFRDEFLRRIIVSDPHAPNEYRCNGVLANMPEFAAAYGLRDGDGMYKAPEERIKIW